jgi:hypothetical protein
LQPKKDKKEFSLEVLKKSELIDCFLKKGFDLKGKVPEELQGVK